MANGLVDQAQAVESEAPTGEESNLTPEEQKTYDSAMQMVGELVYNNDQGHDAIMGLLAADRPAESIAEATLFLIEKVEETFQGKYPEELILPTADEASDLLLELASEANVFEVTEQIAVDAKGQVVQLLMEEYGADPEDVQGQLEGVTQDDVAEMQKMFGGQNA